ncbi:DedA family protein [Streptomyces minutiscleroticus]|uniref:DedA family protein n=1 Tax=Streptomyces minutiscleroticus TaxID=68238 RepID=UPI003332F7A1
MMELALGPSWLDPDYLLNSFGIWGLLLIVFAESGLLIGFFLPGDSLLFTAGMLITSGTLDFPLWGAIALICLAAVLGDQAGYMFGKKVGPSLFTRPDSRLFKQENVAKAHEFFEKHGPKSLILARFVPVVRTFTPIIAGVSGMRYRSFLIFNVVGGVLWGAGVTLLGSWLGQVDFVKENIEAILILIVLVSVVPIVIEFLRARGKAKKEGGAADDAGDGPRQDAAPYDRQQAPYGDDPRHQQPHYGNQYQQPQQGQQQSPSPYGGPQQGHQQPYYGDPHQQQAQQQPYYGNQYQQPQQQYYGHQQQAQQPQQQPYYGEQYQQGQQAPQPQQPYYGHQQQAQQQPYYGEQYQQGQQAPQPQQPYYGDRQQPQHPQQQYPDQGGHHADR